MPLLAGPPRCRPHHLERLAAIRYGVLTNHQLQADMEDSSPVDAYVTVDGHHSSTLTDTSVAEGNDGGGRE
jgi:hypothetical protein